MILLNSIISLASEIGMNITILIAIAMIDVKLAFITAGLRVIKFIADVQILRENQKALQQLFDKGEEL